MQANIMRDEVRNLRNLLLMHKDCPINGAQSFISSQQQQQQKLIHTSSSYDFTSTNKNNLMML
jgi:hypothetical protein